MTQFSEGKGYHGNRTIKNLSFKIQEATSNVFSYWEKKEKQFFRQIIYTNQEHLPTEVNPDIDFTDEQV